MSRFALCTLVVMTAVFSESSAKDKNPAIQALKEEVKALRAHEKAEVAALKARYQALIDKLKNADTKEEELRAELRKEEKLLLAGVKDKAERKAIEARFAAWIRTLSGDIKERKEIIKELKAQRNTLVKRLRAAYAQQIAALEQKIKALEGGGKGKK